MKTTAYKGFNKNWTCRDFQYEVGKSYEHVGEFEPCQSGFHSCLNPLDIFNYYPPSDAVFAEVTYTGEVKTHSEDSKVVGSNIEIAKELSLHEICVLGVGFIVDNVEDTKTNTGDRSASTNTGYRSASEVSGNSSVAIATGVDSKAKASKGSAIVLCSYDDEGTLKHIKSAIVGKGKVKADTWYTLNSAGQFEEVK